MYMGGDEHCGQHRQHVVQLTLSDRTHERVRFNPRKGDHQFVTHENNIHQCTVGRDGPSTCYTRTWDLERVTLHLPGVYPTG